MRGLSRWENQLYCSDFNVTLRGAVRLAFQNLTSNVLGLVIFFARIISKEKMGVIVALRLS